MKKLSLNGKWQIKSEAEKDWVEAKVPGSVYENLMNAGLIEDPFYRDNEGPSKAVSERDYTYRRTFALDKDFLNSDRIYLECEGIDTIAEIRINGRKVMNCENMHMVLETEVKDALKAGENEIQVAFTSPYKEIERIKASHPDMDLDRHLFQAKMQMRKAACMFGWDWGPALADMGIYRSLSLKAYDGGRITDLSVCQEHSFGKVKLFCTAETESYQAGKKLRFSVYDPEGALIATETYGLEEGGETFVCTVQNPRLWWCIGYGEQPLYTVKAEVLNEKEEVLHEVSHRIGLRTLTICQEKDSFGESFYFKINDVEVFARGADYIPEDSLLGRMTAERSRKMLDNCIKANFNMIRVWGGGIYPTEEFFDYCDEKGLMVWQDFMFANIVTIWEGRERENMESEVIQLTRRMRNHPCIALLCGNNETELMVWDTMEKRFKEMYIQQFEVDMKALVKKEAPDIFYWPSSPSSTGSMCDVENQSIGDSHDWNVWHGQKPFTYFRSTFPRFNSEFGLQSFPCLKTIESFTRPEDRNIFSYVMEGHQKSKNGNEVINYYVSQYFKFPKDFKAFLYLSQTIQLEGIRYGVEHWRRNRNDKQCMGSLFWQLNDCWPVASWASVDYFGRWKALQYGARRFFEPLLVSACEEGTRVELHVTNENLVRAEGTLTWKFLHVDKGLIREKSIACAVGRLHSDCIEKLDFSEEIKTPEDFRKYYLAYALVSDGKEVGCGTVMFVPAKHFEFKKPNIRCERIDEKSFRLNADTFCKFVDVEFEEDTILSDNFFDLVPGQEKIITAENEMSEPPVIYSLYDSF